MPHQYEPSSWRRNCTQRNSSWARSVSPIASSAITSSHVSAAVTHGWSDTHRTPRPGTTNVSQNAAMRICAAWPRSTPPRIG